MDGEVFIWRPLDETQLQHALCAELDQHQRMSLSEIDRSWKQSPHLVAVLTTYATVD